MTWRLRQHKNVYDAFCAKCQRDLKEALERRMAILLERGNQTIEPVSKPLGKGLFELRAKAGRCRLASYMASCQTAAWW